MNKKTAYFFYQIIVTLMLPLALLKLLYAGFRNHDYWHRLKERFKPIHSGSIDVWVHAVSVGEVITVAPLIQRLQRCNPSLRILLTTTTPTGSIEAKRLKIPNLLHQYLPYDQSRIIHRFIAHYRPRIGVTMETEIWPNIIQSCHLLSIPICGINMRISDRAYRKYHRFIWLTRHAISMYTEIMAQSPEDEQKMLALGANSGQITLTGNLKYDLMLSEDHVEKVESLRIRLGSRRYIWVAGSTHRGEDESLLITHKALSQEWPDLLLIIAPRHPDRCNEIRNLCNTHGLSHSLHSMNKSQLTQSISVYIIDSIGELRNFYGLAQIAFIGGSLVEIGGHNPLEASIQNVPVLFGPHMQNFHSISSNILAADAGLEVASQSSLLNAIKELLANPEKRKLMGVNGRQLVDANQGAVDLTLKRIRVLARL